MKYFIAFVGILFFTAGALFSADISALSFYTEPALFPFNAVVGIAQDSHDCLYFATQSGLIKYNGVAFEEYEHLPFDNTTIRSSQIKTIYMDTDDVLWLGTYGGLERFDIKMGTIAHYQVSDNVITAVFRDSKRRLWVGTVNGLYLCTDENYEHFTAFHNQRRDYFIGNNTIHSVSEDSHGVIYASTYDGVWQYNEAKAAFERCTLLPAGCPGRNSAVYHFIEDAGAYWFSVWGVGLIRIMPKRQTYEVYSLPDTRIYSLYNNFISKDYIAAGTWGGGLYVINKTTKKTVAYKADHNRQGALTNNVIYTVFISKHNMLFVGTADVMNIADISRISGDIAVPLYTEKTAAKKHFSHLDDTISYLASSPNYLWAASNNILVRYAFDGSEPEEFPLAVGKQETTDMLIHAIGVISDSELWIGTNRGLYLFNAVSGVFTPVPLYHDDLSNSSSLVIQSLFQDKDKTLWIGTYGSGLIHFTPQQPENVVHYRRSNEPFSLSNDIIFFIERDSRGNLWVGTNKGLCRYDPSHDGFISYLYDVDNPAGISSNRIDSFCEDAKGYLWFGTNDGGMCRFDPVTEEFKTYTKSNGLSSNQIIGITDADDGFLWIATQKYLNLFDIKHETVQAYNIANIRQYGYFSCSPVSLKEKGMFFFGTEQGILKISQEKLSAFRVQYVPVKIRSVAVDGRQINLYTEKQPLSFGYRTNDVKICFSAPYGSSRKKIVYAYKLIGFDEDWIILPDKNFVRYFNLPAGTYTFLVKNAAEDSNLIYDSISFTIRPSFLISPVMIWFYILLAILIVFLLYKVRKLYWLQRYTELLEEKQLGLIQDNFTLKELSMLDHLTGIGNRRYIDMIGFKMWQKALEHNAPLSVLMFDIDFFKRYNDLYGHPAGDELLKLIGADLKKRIRAETDMIGRYGGEEFLVVMYNVLSDKAVTIADGIRKAIETLHERHQNEMAGKTTISIGVFSAIPSDEDSFELMVYKADCALYRAKQTGRNRVLLYDEAIRPEPDCNVQNGKE